MNLRMWCVWLGALAMASGCAGQRYNQEMSRLKSDMGLLDQRLGQLERGSVQSTASLWPSDSALQPIAPGSGPAAPPSASAAAAMPSKKQIQQALKNAGLYQGPLDGKIGPVTRAAIREFQRVNGLTADGTVGPKTWAKLSPYLDFSAEGASTASVTEPIK